MSGISMTRSNRAAIEAYIRQLHGADTDDRAKLHAVQQLGCLWLYLPSGSRGRDTLPVAAELGAWDALIRTLTSGLDATDLEDACAIALSQLLVPPLPTDDAAACTTATTGRSSHRTSTPAAPLAGRAAGGAERPASSLLVRRLLERLASYGFALGQLAAVLQSSASGSRGVRLIRP